LRTAAAGASDVAAQAAFEKYATNVETLAKSPDLEVPTPDTSGWLLDLAPPGGKQHGTAEPAHDRPVSVL
jgi:hypothetical protein